MSNDDPVIQWLMKNFCVSRELAQEMRSKHKDLEMWKKYLRIMIHIGEEYYFTSDGKIHPKRPIKARRIDRTMI